MSKKYLYKTSLENKLAEMPNPFEMFVDTQKIAGIILIFCIFISLFLVNTPILKDYYHRFTAMNFGFNLNDIWVHFTFQEFVDDFLLFFFFFVLGLEIKREFVVGELANFKRANIVVMAAFGGVFFPVIIYSLFNYHSEAFINGWGIPIATDTAIAIGIMSLFKKYLPQGVFPFIAALAVLDDIIAITVIAIFYTEQIQTAYLFYALINILIMIIANIAGVRRATFYTAFGLSLWALFELSGIHGTIAGVIVSFTIPARPQDRPHLFVTKMKFLLKRFEKKHDVTQHILETEEQHKLLEQVTEESIKATTPLKRWEGKFEKPVLLIILPLFALTNGAVVMNYAIFNHAIHTSLFWGIFCGLLIGKPIGIYVFTMLGLKTNIGTLPSDMHPKHIIPISLLAGIGYTMSIFIANLAFDNKDLINTAKLSIIIGSVIAACFASVIIYQMRDIKKKPLP